MWRYIQYQMQNFLQKNIPMTTKWRKLPEISFEKLPSIVEVCKELRIQTKKFATQKLC